MFERDQISYRNLTSTIKACLRNGERLLDESMMLEFQPTSATRYYLAVIAQEEFAKALMIFLVREAIAPLNGAVLRALKDHTCKQLLGIVMDYVIMHWEDIGDLERMIRADSDLQGQLPYEVDSALTILRYEKIGRWESHTWFWTEDPVYHPDVQAVANGRRDRRKQDALYVGVGRDGSVSSVPDVREPEAYVEHERARRYLSFVRDASGPASNVGGFDRRRFDIAMNALRVMFSARLSTPAKEGTAA